MAIFASFVHCLPNILHTWPHDSFQVIGLSMTLGIFKVIGLFHIKFLKNGVWYGKSYYRQLIRNHTLAFDWCHFWCSFEHSYIWRSFQPRLSFPRPFQLSLACFRVARSPSISWASCIFCPMHCIALDRQLKDQPDRGCLTYTAETVHVIQFHV